MGEITKELKYVILAHEIVISILESGSSLLSKHTLMFFNGHI